MRRSHPQPFQVARRGLSREINRRLVLDLVRTRQPLSRADLARLMGTTRGAVSLIVNALVRDGLVFEGATGEAARGRKPKFLYIDSRKRCIVAVDVRPTRTSLMVTDLLGDPLVGMSSFATQPDASAFLRALADRVKQTLAAHPEMGRCEGIGVVVPGMVDRTGEKLVFAPRLHWHDLPLRSRLAELTGLPVHIENSGRACALAQLWTTQHAPGGDGDLAYVSVSDGLGIGVVVRGEVLRGRHNVAGEFGHTPLNIDGPPCACGATGCLEAYVSNIATLSRYFGREISPRKPLPAELATFTVEDLVTRARSGDGKAIAALQSTARYLGIGLAGLVNAYDPPRIHLAGEIMAAWDLIEPTIRQAIRERALAPAVADVEIVPVPSPGFPRLRGAAALVAAPLFAGPAAATRAARPARSSGQRTPPRVRAASRS
jgi:predicted NBD/HSP70 family sugar kinase